MAYTKPAQAAFQANLDVSINEFVVQLSDTLNYVAVSCVTSIEPNSGNPVFKGKARVVNADGSPMLDSNGARIESTYSQTSTAGEVASLGGSDAVSKQCLLAVLGEATTLWNDPIHSTQMQNASIRNTLASVPHTGPAATSSLL
jgi:hypothetical protein